MTRTLIVGGKFINQGYKGLVMDVYNKNTKDKKTLYKIQQFFWVIFFFYFYS